MLKVAAVAWFVGIVGGFLAQATPSTPSSSADPWVAVLQWGPAGVVLVLLGTGQLRFGREVKKQEELYEKAEARATKAEADRDAVNTKTANEFIPLLTEATRILGEFKPKTQEQAIASELSVIVKKLDDMTKKTGQ